MNLGLPKHKAAGIIVFLFRGSNNLMQNVLCVLQPLAHLRLILSHDLRQGIRVSTVVFANVSHTTSLGSQNDGGLVKEIDLDRAV